MAVKIRLSRKGRTHKAFYHIVVADERAPRDGRYIERVGTYNPHENPAPIQLNVEQALSWLQKGAQPTPTVRQILSSQGVLLRKHLQMGVDKGVITQAIADKRFATWQKAAEKKKRKPYTKKLPKLKTDTATTVDKTTAVAEVASKEKATAPKVDKKATAPEAKPTENKQSATPKAADQRAEGEKATEAATTDKKATAPEAKATENKQSATPKAADQRAEGEKATEAATTDKKTTAPEAKATENKQSATPKAADQRAEGEKAANDKKEQS